MTSRWRRARRRPATGCGSSRASTGRRWRPRRRFCSSWWPISSSAPGRPGWLGGPRSRRGAGRSGPGRPNKRLRTSAISPSGPGKTPTARRAEAEAARQSLQRSLYASDMQLAEEAWESGDIPRMRRPAGGASAAAGRARPARLRVALPLRAGHDRPCRRAGPGRDLRTAQSRRDALRLCGSARGAAAGRRGHEDRAQAAGRASGRPVRRIIPFPGESMGNVDVRLTFSPDGKRFLLATSVMDASGRFRLAGQGLRLGDRTRRVHARRPRRRAGGAAFDRTGGRLAMVAVRENGRAGSDLRIWSLDGGQRRLTIPLPGRQVVHLQHSVAFSPDGTCVAALTKPAGPDPRSSAGEIRAWDAGSGEERLRFETGPASAALAYSPNGKWLAEIAVGGASHRLRDAGSGKEVLELTTAPTAGTSWAIAFSPDGSRLAVSSEDSKVRIWNVADGGTRRRPRRSIASWMARLSC